jgi:hypothetical protein
MLFMEALLFGLSIQPLCLRSRELAVLYEFGVLGGRPYFFWTVSIKIELRWEW